MDFRDVNSGGPGAGVAGSEIETSGDGVGEGDGVDQRGGIVAGDGWDAGEGADSAEGAGVAGAIVSGAWAATGSCAGLADSLPAGAAPSPPGVFGLQPRLAAAAQTNRKRADLLDTIMRLPPLRIQRTGLGHSRFSNAARGFRVRAAKEPFRSGRVSRSLKLPEHLEPGGPATSRRARAAPGGWPASPRRTLVAEEKAMVKASARPGHRTPR